MVTFWNFYPLHRMINKALDSYRSYKKIVLAGDLYVKEKDMDVDFPVLAWF